jgi:hypothetical protein
VNELLDPPGTRAPALQVASWLGAGAPESLEALRGRVVVVHAFQLLCPGCVHHGIPQAKRIRETFSPKDVAVLGLHTVFEHHEAMGPAVLRAFLHENRIAFPVGIDQPSGDAANPIPLTMRAYGMRGTPTLLLIDRRGDLRRHAFGAEEDMAVGAAISALIAEPVGRA